MGKTRWEWVAQALLETLTAARGSTGSTVRPSKEEKGKGKKNRRSWNSSSGSSRRGSGFTRRRRRRRRRRRKGKQPEESSESYEIWPPYEGVCTRSPGLGSGCEGIQRTEYAERRRRISGTMRKRKEREREREKTKETNFKRISWLACSNTISPAN